MKPPQIKRKIFVQWLEKQPDNRIFQYSECSSCLLYHFFLEMYGIRTSIGGMNYRLSGNFMDYEDLPDWLISDPRLLQAACNDIKVLKRALITVAI